MADYLPLLSRAVIGKRADEREAIYLRARAALERQLRGFDPPLEELSIKAELDALEAVVVTVERNVLEAEAALEVDSPAVTEDAVQGPDVVSATPEATQPVPAEDEPSNSGMGDTAVEDSQAASHAAPLGHVERRWAGEAAEPDHALAIPDDQDYGPAVVQEETASLQPTLRPRVPVRDERVRPRKRVALFAGLALVAMLIMGLIALSQRDRPGRLEVAATPPVPTQPRDEGEGPKTEGRLATGEQAPRTPETQPVPQPPRPAEPQRQASAVPPARNGAVETPAATTSRAFMVLESGSGAPSQFEGLAAWSFVPDPALGGAKSLKTIVAFPQANLTIDIGFARNSDQAVNASHTIMVVFDSGGEMENVREMSPIEWRERETQAGQALAGIVVPVQDNVFMIGLDRTGNAPQRNLDILRAQRWMVFEVRLANGRRGAVLIEKGAAGDKAVGEALSEWR